jgi:HTH-type transcriptional regulator / antitoxin HigA
MATTKPGIIPYMKLVQALPLRPIRSEAELDRATAMMDTLSDRPKLTPEERDYWTVLAGLIEVYEDEHHPIPDAPPGDVLQLLIEARGMTQVQVAEDLGIPVSTLNEFIKGKRGINPRHMTLLGRYFHVPPTVFFPQDGASPPRIDVRTPRGKAKAPPKSERTARRSIR